MKNIEEIQTDVWNYYGEVVFSECEDGKFYLELEDWGGVNKVEISKDFYNMAKKEFKNG